MKYFSLILLFIGFNSYSQKIVYFECDKVQSCCEEEASDTVYRNMKVIFKFDLKNQTIGMAKYQNKDTYTSTTKNYFKKIIESNGSISFYIRDEDNGNLIIFTVYKDYDNIVLIEDKFYKFHIKNFSIED